MSWVLSTSPPMSLPKTVELLHNYCTNSAPSYPEIWRPRGTSSKTWWSHSSHGDEVRLDLPALSLSLQIQLSVIPEWAGAGLPAPIITFHFSYPVPPRNRGFDIWRNPSNLTKSAFPQRCTVTVLSGILRRTRVFIVPGIQE